MLGWQLPPCHVSDEIIVGNSVNPSDGTPGAEGQMHLRLFTGRVLAALAEHHGLCLDAAATAGYYPLPTRLAALATRVDRRHGAFLVHRYTRPAEPNP